MKNLLAVILLSVTPLAFSQILTVIVEGEFTCIEEDTTLTCTTLDTPLPPPPPPPPPTTGALDLCGTKILKQSIKCKKLDYGPGGNEYGYGSSQDFVVTKGQVTSYPFSAGDRGSVRVSIVPRLGGPKPKNGATPKYWISEVAGDTDFLCRAAGRTSSMRCNVEANTTYYLNFTSCTTASPMCTYKKSRPSDADIWVYLQVS